METYSQETKKERRFNGPLIFAIVAAVVLFAVCVISFERAVGDPFTFIKAMIYPDCKNSTPAEVNVSGDGNMVFMTFAPRTDGWVLFYDDKYGVTAENEPIYMAIMGSYYEAGDYTPRLVEVDDTHFCAMRTSIDVTSPFPELGDENSFEMDVVIPPWEPDSDPTPFTH